MRVYIKLEYKEKVYRSRYQELDGDEMETLENLMQKITDGDASRFQFENNNETYYFGRNILNESIITVIKE